MSAADQNPKGEIVPSSSATLLPESGRTLAAIVFTDAANFSALMRRDEENAQRLIARDLNSMQRICSQNGGQVLKSTGDGLLMVFSSAVRAVACALAIQEEFRDQRRSLPFAERLSHRIGIHLGDVFRQEHDVIGDGVNVAARIEAVGWRGCVCVSGTVFEVVRNRLPFYVLSRKQQKLKNVGSFVVYQLAPKGGPFRYFFQAWDFLCFSDARVTKIVVIVVASVILSLSARKVAVHVGDLHSFHDPLRKYALQLGRLGNVDDSGDDDDDDTPGRSPSATYPAAGKTAVSEDEFAIARFEFIRKYDFAGMNAWLARNDVQDRDEDDLSFVCTSIQQTLDWARTHLQTYSEKNPLIVRDEDGREAYQFFPAADGGFGCKLPSTAISLANDQIPPAILGQMLATLLQIEARPDDPASEKLWRGLKFFTSVYQVSLPSWLKEEMDRNARASIKQAVDS